MDKLLLLLIFSLLSLIGGAQCNFKAIGHRGGSSYYYPENTLISLEQGFMEDIFAAEIDVQPTADSVLVLMHDFYLDRTTSGSGEVEHLPLSYLKMLDAGSWKNARFVNTPVPTLSEALLLAEQYRKKLYLNMKIFVPQLIARTIAETGVAHDLIILDPDDLDKVAKYHEILPGCPLVYFGNLPTPLDSPDFYQFLKENGVIAIEIPADNLRMADEETNERLLDIVHSHGLELWAYTVNDPPYLEYLKKIKIDGLETDRPSEAKRVFCNDAHGGFFPEKRVTGQWDFINSLDATIGSKLVAMGDTSISSQKIEFGTTESFRLPPIENSTVSIARIPAFDPNHALRFFSNIAPEGFPGGLSCDNTYSLIFDLLKPAGNAGYTAIFQTSNNNSDDADLFLSGTQNSIGVLEQYHGVIADSTWVRLALVFDLYQEKLDLYLDGNYIASIALNDSQDGRFCINNNWGIQSSNFFSDDDGETNPVFVSSIQLRNYAMNAGEIRYLGSPGATKISTIIVPDYSSDCPEFIEDIQMTRQGDTITFLAQAGDRVNYLWELNKGSAWESITGTAFKNPATPSLSIVRNPGLFEGYKFRCIANNDCQTLSNEYWFKGSFTDPQPVSNQNQSFVLYPNPSKGSFTIDCPETPGNHDLTIYNLLGTEVYRKAAASGKLQVKLPSGTYLIYFQNGKSRKVKKVLITD